MQFPKYNLNEFHTNCFGYVVTSAFFSFSNALPTRQLYNAHGYKMIMICIVKHVHHTCLTYLTCYKDHISETRSGDAYGAETYMRTIGTSVCAPNWIFFSIEQLLRNEKGVKYLLDTLSIT